ncbi:MAG: M13-type metalloendopeptidase, partial [Parabacteroides sp.]|nr:M13-type metalloendopeptidase [Parabacteroides sp.]
MKRLKLFNLLFALFIAFAGLNFASCSDDNNIPEVTPPAEEEDVHVKNPAGDDFYMYVNEAWHKEQAPGDESLGYINDVNQVLAKKLQETTKTMEDLKAVAESYNRMMTTDQQANLERVDAIVDEMLDKIKTKTDAYRMVGECFAAGLMDRNFKLYPMIHEGKVYATFGPGTDNPEANEIYNRPHKYMLNNKFYKFSAQSRSIDEVFKTLAEGIGLNDDYLIGGEEMAAFLTELSQKSLDELKDGIKEAIEGELLPYCGDEYAQSEANYPTTHDYLFGFQLEKLFGYSMSYHYSTQYVTDERKELFKEYGEDLRASFANRIQNNAWLSSATKQEALNKLDKMKCYYGRPDVWLEEGLRVPDKDLLVDNIVEMKKIRTELIGALLGKDRYDVVMIVNILTVGGMHLADYNAYYDPENNAFFVHPCFMIDPEFTPEMKKGEMYALFYILGHEITHGFDLEGSRRDADGNENNWWT